MQFCSRRYTIRRRVRIVNREYNIPYIAGYSSDGPQSSSTGVR
jgi:hypothetical protein